MAMAARATQIPVRVGSPGYGAPQVRNGTAIRRPQRMEIRRRAVMVTRILLVGSTSSACGGCSVVAMTTFPFPILCPTTGVQSADSILRSLSRALRRRPASSSRPWNPSRRTDTDRDRQSGACRRNCSRAEETKDATTRARCTSQGLSGAGRLSKAAVDQVKEKMNCAAPVKAAMVMNLCTGMSGPMKSSTKARIAANVADQSEIVEGHEDAIGADEGEPEVQLAQSFVHHAPGHFAEPEIGAGETRRRAPRRP
jgi:hypothetical protein